MRLIDAGALKFSCGINEDGILYVPFRDIASAPTVDAEPVKHGHWIVKKTATGATYTVCSYCNTSVKYNDEYGTGVLNLKGAPRCPNCGAKMDEVSE